MTNPETPTHEERVQLLAEREDECPDIGEEIGCVDGIWQGYIPILNHPHHLCGGTGRVPRFPMLRRKWSALTDDVGGDDERRGWVPDMSLEALLDAAILADKDLTIWHTARGWRVELRGRSYRRSIPSLGAALSRALMRATLPAQAKEVP